MHPARLYRRHRMIPRKTLNNPLGKRKFSPGEPKKVCKIKFQYLRSNKKIQLKEFKIQQFILSPNDDDPAQHFKPLKPHILYRVTLSVKHYAFERYLRKFRLNCLHLHRPRSIYRGFIPFGHQSRSIISQR